jgi:hypothetical protein
MSFWNNPGASFEGLMQDPWHSMENFGTTGLVPLIPYIGGIVGGIYGGPAGAKAGGAAGQAGVDYFSGNSEARTGEGIFGSLFSGAGKGGMAYGGYDSLGGGDGIMGLFGGDSTNPATGLDWMETGSGYAGNGGYGDDSGGFGIGKGANYTNFVNTSGGSFGNINPMSSISGGDYGLNFGSPSGIASSNSAMGLSDLSPSGTGSNTGFDTDSAQKLLGNLLKNQQGVSQQNAAVYGNEKPMDVIRQAAFLPTPGAVNVQDKQTDLAALIKALRG